MLKKYKDYIICVLFSLLIIAGYISYDNFCNYVPNETVAELSKKYSYHYEKDDILLKKFNKATFLKRVNPSQADFWIKYALLLLDKNQTKKADKILHKLAQSNIALNKFKYYLRLSDYCLKIGIVTPEIKKSAEIFQKFEENLKNKTLYNLLKGKTVAVVGNSDFEIGKNSGEEIDSHDIVIRMNNYRTENYEKDYGKKTDIWVHGFGAKDIEDRTKTHKYLHATITGNYYRLPVFFDEFLDIFYRNTVENKISYGALNPYFFMEICYKYQIEPSTGFQVIYALYKMNIDFDVYGFSFLEKKLKTDYLSHYFEKDEPNRIILPNPHKYEKENIILNGIVNGRSFRANKK